MTRRCPAQRGPWTFTSTMRKWDPVEIVTSPVTFAWSATDPCGTRESASPVTPEYKAPFHFTGEIER